MWEQSRPTSVQDENKLPEGTEVTINIAFTYTIGEEGYQSGRLLESVSDCRYEALEEIESGALDFPEFSLGEVNFPEG